LELIKRKKTLKGSLNTEPKAIDVHGLKEEEGKEVKKYFILFF